MDRNMQHRHQRASNARVERNKAGKAKSNTLEKQATTGTGLDTATIITTMPRGAPYEYRCRECTILPGGRERE